MFIKSKKVKLMIIVAILLIICTSIGVLKYRESIFATRTISASIDIDKYSLTVDCYGKGTPTVIFEAGLASNHFTWAAVQPEISKITRTFSYDRANRIHEIPRTSLDQVKDLHALLKKEKVKGPYIIVAHSIAGHNARLFASTYPKEVAGIVFVDSRHENESANLSPEVVEEKKKLFANIELHFDEVILSDNLVKETRKKDALRNIPIVVLAADHEFDTIDEQKTWLNYQKDLATLSDHSKFIPVKNCMHLIQGEEPQLVIDSIKELIDTVRK